MQQVGRTFLVSRRDRTVGTEIQIESCFDEDVFEELDDLQGEDVLAHVISDLEDTSLQCKHATVSMVCQQHQSAEHVLVCAARRAILPSLCQTELVLKRTYKRDTILIVLYGLQLVYLV